MNKWVAWLSALGLVAALGCGGLKYAMLKGTSISNPPAGPIKIYVKEFPVKSKASVVDPTAAVSSPYDPSARSSGGGGSGLASNTRDIEITRPSRIEDLAGAVLRELRQEQLRIFFELDAVYGLGDVRRLTNPFELVDSESSDAHLEISGKAMIRSRRISKKFTQRTDSVEIELIVKDLQTGKVLEKEPLAAGINMVFNSTELEEAMAVAVVTHMLQKTPF